MRTLVGRAPGSIVTVPGQVVWVDAVGLGTETTLRPLGELFHIHPLALEDVVHVHPT